MSKKRYDLAVKTGTYMKDGEEKNRYQNIGAVFQGDNGFYMVLDRTFNPAGVPNPDNRDGVIVSMFEPRGSEKIPQQPPRAPQQATVPPDDFDYGAPF